jgi:hypothetical protein
MNPIPIRIKTRAMMYVQGRGGPRTIQSPRRIMKTPMMTGIQRGPYIGSRCRSILGRARRREERRSHEPQAEADQYARPGLVEEQPDTEADEHPCRDEEVTPVPSSPLLPCFFWHVPFILCRR